jgi:superfamily II DNA or RNA helicase
MPISWKGTLQQYVGRLHRLHENKKEEVLVYDYSDLPVPMLARMYQKRLAGYSALGYIVVSASEKRSHSRRVWPEPGIHYQNPAGKDAVEILY